MTRFACALAVTLGLALAFQACNGGGDAGSPAPEESEGTWLSLLARIPDTPDTRPLVIMNDYQRMREMFDIPQPSSEADTAELEEYLIRLSLADPEALVGRGVIPTDIFATTRFPLKLAELRTELGFTLGDVDQDAQAGTAPDHYQVLRGRFDAAALSAAVHTDPLLSDQLEEGAHQGVSYFTWGEDQERLLDPFESGPRPSGHGYRLAIDEGYVYWTRWTGGIVDPIETGLTKKPSLAEREEYQLLAEGLASLETYTALFSGRRLEDVLLGALDLISPEYREAIENAPLLRTYDAHATGTGSDSEGQFIAIVLVHEDEEAARENVRRLAERIDAGIPLPSQGTWRDVVLDTDISSEGPVLLAKLHTSNATHWRPPDYFNLLYSEGP